MSQPSKKRTADEAATAAQLEHGDSRLELNVITGSLWQPTCQALDPVPSKIPLVFYDESQYRRTFEPLLMEEARGSLRAEFDEAILASKGWPVFVTRCSPAKDGVFNLTLRPSDGGHAVVLREGAIVVLIRPATEGQMGGCRGAQGQQQQKQIGGAGSCGPGPGSLVAMARAAASALRWQQTGGGVSGIGGADPPADTVSPMLAAMVRMRTRDGGQALEVAVRPCCGHQAHLEDSSPCNRALHMMFGSGVTTEADDGSPEMATAAGNGAESNGRAGSPSGTLWLWLIPLTSLITNVRELRVLQRLGNIVLLPELLRPSNFGMTGAAELPQVWPQDARHEAFYKHLYSQYDVPQREAIVAAAAHLATPEDLAEAEAQGIATGAAGPGSGATRAPGDAEKATRPLVPPITLVQGPPGTGKTHTVRGILNTWHSTMYHRHHTAWLHRAREILTRSCGRGGSSSGTMLDMYCSGNGVGNGGVGNLLDALSQAPLGAPKPRILVCAPSNAATDELLDRILTDGFCDFGGTSYRPNVVRVGAEEAPLSDAVKAVWTEAMINRYEAMGAELWALAYKDCEARISNCNIYMASMATKMASKGGSSGTDADIAGQDLDRMAAELVRLNDHLSRAREEMARLDRMGDLATSGANRPPGYVLRRIREDLELSLMEEAEMVFTTLSSTGRTVFSRLSRGFDFVLIDEAAQASEIAALQPLMYGCRKLVMVGDPQQLPATLFSAAAKETLLERSLFERLAQAGMAVKMLSVQYRMHPEIRSFPSSYFYGNRLQDGESVLRAAQQPPGYYAADLLKPYVVYDVCNGREYLQGRSRSNEAEAEIALGLYMELLATVRGDPGVGVAAADAVASAAGSGGGRGLREPTPPGRGPGAAGNGAGSSGAGAGTETGRGESVEKSMGAGGDAGSTAAAGMQQAFSFLERYTGTVTVGIITPYRAQRELIRRKFVEVLGPGVLDAVRIETVDSFQGKQLDVIILSCVRTVRPGMPPPTGGAGMVGGVGFLSDIRRMNVAITRAKQALWVLGQFSALRREPSWAALIADAEERGCVIQEANALELCPQLEAFQERQYATAAAARVQQQQQQQQQQEQQQAAAATAAPASLQEHLQHRLGQGPGQGPMPMGPGASSPPGYGLGLGAGQLLYQPPPPPPRPAGAPLDWPQPQGLPPQGPLPGRQMQQAMPPPPQGPGMEVPAQGPEGGLPPQAQMQLPAAPPGHAPHAHPRVGSGRTGGSGRSHHRPRSLNQMQIRIMPPQLQPQPLAGQQQHAAAGAPTQQGPGRGRSALVSMLPK
ncbi:hypothetical protein VaNZ11_013870, partial [Volvox africanus]